MEVTSNSTTSSLASQDRLRKLPVRIQPGEGKYERGRENTVVCVTSIMDQKSDVLSVIMNFVANCLLESSAVKNYFQNRPNIMVW
jgi:hypothetical protein